MRLSPLDRNLFSYYRLARVLRASKVREGLAARFEGLPDVHYGNAEHFVDEFADTGISNGASLALISMGPRSRCAVATFYKFRLGRVIRKDSYWRIVERG
jgi:hypothetical protein